MSREMSIPAVSRATATEAYFTKDSSIWCSVDPGFTSRIYEKERVVGVGR
jgi:hypothetical protein